ncbi:hypothetical protein G7048_15695 [Diaphorobacter sp. HDW4B]|uniref:hypothetical protein n=1 Tax=Diaphorobacter sp. HDW4B TaxID=2714925 RepID=UPI00140CAA51|nr:hypothetical protein [Diaphorobacter sp. HDW4B]QIL71671.1 hypothetical protein G7048_15695 [Diaphorobacter sp. HDW4B]
MYYPPLDDEARYLLDYLQALDYVESGLSGPIKLSFGEIESWTRLMSVHLQAWEVTFLRSMSTAFARELHAAENPSHPAPWAPVVEQIDRKRVARRIKDVLRS